MPAISKKENADTSNLLVNESLATATNVEKFALADPLRPVFIHIPTIVPADRICAHHLDAEDARQEEDETEAKDRQLWLRLVLLIALAVISLFAIVTISTQLILRHVHPARETTSGPIMDTADQGNVWLENFESRRLFDEDGMTEIVVEAKTGFPSDLVDDEDAEQEDFYQEHQVLFYPVASLEDERNVIERSEASLLKAEDRLLLRDTSSDIMDFVKPSVRIE